MQGLTRNPLADPGILGVNAGAALFVVIGIYCFGLTSLFGYVWFAFAGAAVASASSTRWARSAGRAPRPVKLALAGAALTALLGSVTTAILLLDVQTLDQFRFWIVGSLAGRTATIAASVAPFVAAGLLLALASGPMLNAPRPRRRRRPRRSASASAWPRVARRRRHRPAVRRSHGRRRPDRLRRPGRPARRPGDHRARLPLDPALLDRARPGPAARRRHHRPGHRPAGRAAGRHRHRAPRRSGVHRPRPQQQAGRAVSVRPPPSRSRRRACARRQAPGVAHARRSRSRSSCRPLFVAICVSISVGDFPIPLDDVIPAILGAGHRGRRVHRPQLRLPRALTGALVGASFGLSGAIFQTLARNPLASPDIIGIDAGASAAAVFCIVVLHAAAGVTAVRRPRRRARHRGRHLPARLDERRVAATGSCSSASASPRCCRASPSTCSPAPRSSRPSGRSSG